MNPYRILREDWAQALASQINAEKYSMFVAMPFDEKYSYRSKDILENVICKAALKANEKKEVPRLFDIPKRVDSNLDNAIDINEKLIKDMLFSHIVICDLTNRNVGASIELGIALGSKPVEQIIMISQDQVSEIHFDIKSNNVIQYNLKNPEDNISNITKALIKSAQTFESEVDNQIRFITHTLSPDAMMTLEYGGKDYKENTCTLHEQNLPPLFRNIENGLTRFVLATKELLDKELIWTDHDFLGESGSERFGMHITEFGWAVINREWPSN